MTYLVIRVPFESRKSAEAFINEVQNGDLTIEDLFPFNHDDMDLTADPVELSVED